MFDNLNSFLEEINTRIHHLNDSKDNRNIAVTHLPPKVAFERVKLMKIELKLAEIRELRKEQKKVLMKKYMVSNKISVE